VVDQTPQHEPQTEATLREWAASGRVRVVHREIPSQPGAMNCALRESRTPLVLFLDDDIVPKPDLVERHATAHGDPEIWAVVGQILQPGEEPAECPPSPGNGQLRTDLDFPFRSSCRGWIRNCMSGNLCVRRDAALRIGGFDENFCLTVAYRFDTDFGRRIWKNGGKILFEPSASLRHLRAIRGGTRTGLDHLRSYKPDHSIGDYYFALLHGTRHEAFAYSTHRLFRSVTTRFHLRHPWWIPPKLVGEIRGLLGAMRLARQGPKLLERTTADNNSTADNTDGRG
jgi:GT2 family glycosyltransferase